MESSFSGSSPLPIKCGRVKMVATGKLKDWTDGGKRVTCRCPANPLDNSPPDRTPRNTLFPGFWLGLGYVLVGLLWEFLSGGHCPRGALFVIRHITRLKFMWTRV